MRIEGTPPAPVEVWREQTGQFCVRSGHFVTDCNYTATLSHANNGLRHCVTVSLRRSLLRVGQQAAGATAELPCHLFIFGEGGGGGFMVNN